MGLHWGEIHWNITLYVGGSEGLNQVVKKLNGSQTRAATRMVGERRGKGEVDIRT